MYETNETSAIGNKIFIVPHISVIKIIPVKGALTIDAKNAAIAKIIKLKNTKKELTLKESL